MAGAPKIKFVSKESAAEKKNRVREVEEIRKEVGGGSGSGSGSESDGASGSGSGPELRSGSESGSESGSGSESEDDIDDDEDERDNVLEDEEVSTKVSFLLVGPFSY